jgi:murein L,D-transpeptidase YcbB/YkuD
MIKKVCFPFPIVLLFVIALFTGCKGRSKPPVTEIVHNPQELDQKVTDVIVKSLQFAADNNGVIDEDSTRLNYTSLVQFFYTKKQFGSIWSGAEQWKALGDSMYAFLDQQAKLYGMFPEDYHYVLLDSVRKKFQQDHFADKEKRDAVIWAKADIMLTDAFIGLVKDLKLGRLPADSVTLRSDSVLTDDYYYGRLALVQKYNSLNRVFVTLEPKHEGYVQLKAGIPAFLDSADYKVYTIVPLPAAKSPLFKKLLQARLVEGGFLAADTAEADTAQISLAIKKFQESRSITIDGKAGTETIRILNTTDKDRFIRIAITLDRYKLLPEKMPSRYVWVNLPGFIMKLVEDDTLKLTSKIICGKPNTRTPLLTSEISTLITYPQWTVPASIIEKEILPGVKRDSDYLAKKGFSLVDKNGEEVDPHTVEWWRYKKGIPYKVVQGSGDENALGVLKFSFPNKYAVYLHDTNQRYLFTRNSRSLSHGCVRVQNWEKLAYGMIRYDEKEAQSLRPSSTEDSLTTWLQRKEKHSISVRNRLPVYIRYFTCEANDKGKVVFYDDIYGEDRQLKERHFAGK